MGKQKSTNKPSTKPQKGNQGKPVKLREHKGVGRPPKRKPGNK